MMTDIWQQPKTIAITGGLGNLGQKLFHHLATLGTYTRFVSLDVRSAEANQLDSIRQVALAHHPDLAPPIVEHVQSDLADWHDDTWRKVINEVEAVVHFAAQNPYPEATWTEVTASLDMSLNVMQAAADSPTLKRFVFSTSNHVMGRYKDSPLAEQIGPGELRPDLEVGVGTVWHTGQEDMDSTPYAVAKFAGERMCHLLGLQTAGKTRFVCIRVGWCQPGENKPATLSATGSPTLQGGTGPGLDAETQARAERWFKGMWLSNRDFVQLFQRALETDGASWPGGCITVNGMSNNTGMKWSLDETRQLLGYDPQDDVYS